MDAFTDRHPSERAHDPDTLVVDPAASVPFDVTQLSGGTSAIESITTLKSASRAAKYVVASNVYEPGDRVRHSDVGADFDNINDEPNTRPPVPAPANRNKRLPSVADNENRATTASDTVKLT